MAGVLSPRETGRLIAETSKDVSICTDGIKKTAQLVFDHVKKDAFSVKSWKEHELNPKTMDKAAVDWVFLADTLNFSFYSDDETKKYSVEYGGKKHTGYWSLCAAINRALDDGIPITDPNYYASIGQEKLASILRSDTDYNIPLLDKRVEVLHEAGSVLLKKYDGSFINCIKQSEKSAQSLLKLVVEDFPAYRDEAEYNGKKVAFYKRAQILIADVWGCCEGQGYGEFNDIDTITMFADYRIPQCLVYFGALKYSDDLLQTLHKGVNIGNGDRQEMEIRGCSIWATELICEETKKLLAADPQTVDADINAILVDHYLWDYRREKADEMRNIPFHKTRCIYY
ncbi:Q-nucleotide N-glycosylase 1 isoform X2 [Patella vulgata]|nr:Q-nucleotide N-glycosylase 1 isoform X2 [Patella vulgata]XP_050413076.1 Q-nucleotide N-glycosylase 1 isoform X2 [Patella vulgata]XP_050413077.1 Q-nucleotide N-glycosylase 1 isoform X2 [Patella vulgata]XP_050413078.1 Q-nucleotide N-glycosylase 1 isoform X2 [Patella vulgata]